MLLNLIFGGIAVVCIIALVSYRLQVRLIMEQLKFIKENDTNKLIAKQLSMQEVVELTDNLNEVLRSCRKMVKEYGIKDSQLKETITNISHDIRTPLTSLDGYFQLLKEAERVEDRQRYYTIINSRIGSLKEILEQLFTYVKLQNDEYELESEKVNINQVICDVLFSFYEELKTMNLDPEVELPDQVSYAMVNHQAMKRVLQNIIKNALDHGKDNLNLKMEIVGTEILISISNRQKEEDFVDSSKVFERFYKADESRSHISTGLGLSIAKELVEKMDGKIEAQVINDTFGIKLRLKNVE